MPAILQRFRSVNAILAATAVLTGVLAFWGASRYVETRASLVEQRLSRDYVAQRIVVASSDLPAGKTLEASDMAARAVPVRFAASDRVIAERAGTLAGRRTTHALRKGDPLGLSDVETPETSSLSARLAIGQRAITFPVDEVNSFSGLLVPGDVIDLLYSTREDARAAQVMPLLQSVRVLATGKLLRRHRVQDAAGNQREVASEFVTITLHVSPDEAARVVLAQQTGELTAVLRNGEDQKPLSFTRMNSSALLSPARTGSARARNRASDSFLELIVGGSGGVVATSRRVPVLALAGTESGADGVLK